MYVYLGCRFSCRLILLKMIDKGLVLSFFIGLFYVGKQDVISTLSNQHQWTYCSYMM